MSVRWDAVLCGTVATELNGLLRGARIRAVDFAHARTTCVLYTDGGALEARLSQDEGHLLLHPATTPPEGARRLSGRVHGISAPADERRLHIVIGDRRGGSVRGELVLEMGPRRRNALLLEGPDRILRARLRAQAALPTGLPLPEPRGPGRDGVQDRGDVAEWLQGLGAPVTRQDLLAHVAWVSPLNVQALLEACGDPSAPDIEGFLGLLDRLRGAVGPPGLVDPQGERQPYPVRLAGRDWLETNTVLEALGLAAGQTPDTALLSPQLLERTGRALTRLERLIASLERELESAEDPEAIRERANLLLARLKSIPSGAARAVVEGFDGAPVALELDPSLSAGENADRWFTRAKRAARARATVPARIQEARALQGRMVEALASVTEGNEPPESLAALLPERSTDRSSSGAAAAPLPYRRFQSSGGLEIRVGRSARANDRLTFQDSRPGDVWLHARHVGGAHVVLRWNDDAAPPARDLEEAAMLAALHSRARHSSSVPVDWTRRKYVRKPRGAAPGSVLVERIKTVFVDPDPGLAERLSAD